MSELYAAKYTLLKIPRGKKSWRGKNSWHGKNSPHWKFNQWKSLLPRKAIINCQNRNKGLYFHWYHRPGQWIAYTSLVRWLLNNKMRLAYVQVLRWFVHTSSERGLHQFILQFCVLKVYIETWITCIIPAMICPPLIQFYRIIRPVLRIRFWGLSATSLAETEPSKHT